MKTSRVNHYWISDHNYLIKVLQTCLWTSSRLIFISSQCFIWYLHPLEVGVKKKKEKKRKKCMLDVRNTSSRVWHITSILLLGGWISDETPFLIFDILSQAEKCCIFWGKGKRKKKKPKLMLNWKRTTTTTKFIENWKITNYIAFPPANSLQTNRAGGNWRHITKEDLCIDGLHKSEDTSIQ